MPAAAAAIETATFGIDVATPSSDGRLHITTRAGETTSGALRLFNKTDGPLAIKITVSPATVDATGRAELGGDATPVSWIKLSADELTLQPRQERIIDVRVNAPRRLPAEDASVAVVAEPTQVGGEAPGVLQRVAVTTLLEPDDGGLVAGLGWYPWLALALLVVAAGLALKRLRGRQTGH